MKASRTTVGLLLLATLALGLRVGVVLALRSEHAAPISYEHGRIAENLLAGRGFSIEFLGTEGPTSQQAPFYPFLLAGVYGCLGVATPEAVLTVQLLQCAVGTLLVLTVAWLGWSLLPDRPSVGWLAGVGAAVFPTHLYMVTHLQVVLWAALLLTTLLAVVVSPRWQRTWAGALLAGCLSGALLMVEPILALALPICAVAFWLAEDSGRWRDRWRVAVLGRVALMAGVAALIIAPWLIRNRLVHGRFVFVKSSFGYAFWQGNNPSSWGTDKIPKPSAEILRRDHDGTLSGIDRAMWEARHETLYIDDVLLKPTGYAEFAGLGEPERSDLLGRRAWTFIRNHPDRYAGLCVQRLRYFLLFDETNPKAANRLYRLTTVVWLVLALVGLAASCGRWRQLWPTCAVFAAVTLFHSLVIVSTRFRIPLEPMAMVWAASALAPLLVHLRLKRPARSESARAGEIPSPHRHGIPRPHFRLSRRTRV
ncbi:MAG: hypothetical protein HQ581_28530 [Planctomycetes bacterium]|nr:hypothetical protein [Planctomycetota bacterium]